MKNVCAKRYNYAAVQRTSCVVNDFRQEFLAFAVARDVLRFGKFVTKAGRSTPYFFNAGLFNDGESLRRLGRYYAEAMLAARLECDQLFGPAYKGITLAAATAIALAETP
jgi:orotate phosphoribosyltransferase